ncbi:hypothetical protein TeGR_g2268 [Tetraparma gracilis]|uniref:Uncharacterized protein n=1 Tax=Tetraparma gracilis TaxID=2962635 RepID=A0ABQ6M767_9STRA|nr:hypothetical protein TeGR_g2268 [Tetraparma gracilis]
MLSRFSRSSAPPSAAPLPARAMVKVVHDGRTMKQYEGRADVTDFGVREGVNTIAYSAFARTGLTSLEGLKGLRVPSLEISLVAFDECHELASLQHLPFNAIVNNCAFGRLYYAASYIRDKRCRLLLKKARLLGFADIDAWVQDRRNVPARRWAILTSMVVARKQESLQPERRTVTELAAHIALLPKEMVREIVEFAFGDHLLSNVVWEGEGDVKAQRVVTAEEVRHKQEAEEAAERVAEEKKRLEAIAAAEKARRARPLAGQVVELYSLVGSELYGELSPGTNYYELLKKLENQVGVSVGLGESDVDRCAALRVRIGSMKTDVAALFERAGRRAPPAASLSLRETLGKLVAMLGVEEGKGNLQQRIVSLGKSIGHLPPPRAPTPAAQSPLLGGSLLSDVPFFARIGRLVQFEGKAWEVVEQDETGGEVKLSFAGSLFFSIATLAGLRLAPLAPPPAPAAARPAPAAADAAPAAAGVPRARDVFGALPGLSPASPPLSPPSPPASPPPAALPIDLTADSPPPPPAPPPRALASPLSAGARSATTASSASTGGTPEAIRKERRKLERKRGRRGRKREQENRPPASPASPPNAPPPSARRRRKAASRTGPRA